MRLIIVSRVPGVDPVPDTTAGSIPTNVTATAASQTQINVAWNVSTDNPGGTGIAGYRVYRNGSGTPLQPLTVGNGYSDTGLTVGTYTYRVSSVDNSGNESGLSALASATTLDQTAPSVPTGFTATSISSSQIDLVWNASTDTGGSGLNRYEVERSLNGTSGFVQRFSGLATAFSDTSLTSSTPYFYRIRAVDNATNASAYSANATATTQSSGGLTALQDWTNRSTAAGVVQAKRFTVAADVTNWTHNDGTQSFCSLDTTDGIIGNGCLKITIPTAQDNATGQWRVPLNASWVTDGQGFGSQEFRVQYRVKLGPNRLLHTNGGGFKVANTAGFKPQNPGSSNSHTGHEIVIGNGFNQAGILYAYREHPISGTTPFETTDGNGDIHLQTAVDGGASIADKFTRYCLYQSGNASAGCWRYHENEWFTVEYRIKIVDYGGSGTGNEIDIWATRDGETSRTLLYNNRNFAIGSDSAYPLGVNGIWFLNYDTNRTVGAADTWCKYDQLIVSTQPIALPQVAAQAPSTAPSWFTSTVDKRIVAPLSNSLASVADPLSATTNAGNTHHHSIVDTYNALMVDAITGDVALLGNGGHSDYAGNEVYHVNLKTQTAWARRRNATAAQGGGTGEFRNWSDGRPTANHTYDYLVGANGRWFSMGRAADNWVGGGMGKSAVFEFTHGTAGLSNNNDWIDYGNIRAGGGGTGDIWAGYDPTNDWIISVAGHDDTPAIQAFRVSDMASVATNSTTTINDSNVFVGAIDTTHRIVLLRTGSGYLWFPLASISSGGTWHSITPSNNTLGVEHGFAWHAASQAFVTYKNGTGLIKLVPTFSGGGYTALTGWTTVSGVTGLTPGSPIISMHGRVKIINDMGDGRSALVMLPVYGSPDLYVMPLPAAGI